MIHEGSFFVPRESPQSPLRPSTARPANSHLPSLSEVPQRRAISAGEVPAVFQALDASRRNALDFKAAFAGLGQLGVANGQEAVKTISGLLGKSNPSHVMNHQFTLPEFVACYEMLSRSQYKPSRLDQAVLYSRASEVLEGADNELILKVVYNNYCRYTVGQGKLIYDELDPKMSSTQFVKLTCDLGVLQPTGPLNVVVIDLIFHKCKPHGKNRFQYADFLKALDAIETESELRVMDLICILGAQIKPSPQFVAPKPITSQPKEHYNQRKGLRPTTAWGRPGSGTPAVTSSLQDLRRAIEEAENRKNGNPANLEGAVKKQGAALSNKAQALEDLVMSLHEQVQELKDHKAGLGNEIQYLKELVPEADRARASEIQELKAALLVALRSVGVESVEAAEDPSMLTVADAYHNRFLHNDSMLTELSDRVAGLEASEKDHDKKIEASCHATSEQMSGLGQQMSKLEEQSCQQREAGNQTAEKIWGLGQQLSKLEEQGRQQHEATSQAADKIWVIGQQLSKLEVQGSQQREVANQATEKISGLGQQLSKLEEQGRQQREATSQATEQLSGLGQQVCKLEEQSCQQQQDVTQQREIANQATEQIAALGQQVSKLEEQGSQQHEASSHATEQLSGLGQQVCKLEEQSCQQQHEASQQREVASQAAEQIAALEQQLAKLGEQGSQQQQEVTEQLAALQQNLDAQLTAVQEGTNAKHAVLEQAQTEQQEYLKTKLQAAQQDSLAKLAEVEKWQQENSAKLAEVERWQQEVSAKQQAAQQESLAEVEKLQQECSAKLAELERWRFQQQEKGISRRFATVEEELAKQQDASNKLVKLETEHAQQDEQSGQALQQTAKQLAELQAQLAAVQQVQAEQQQESSKSVQGTDKQLAELQAQLAALQQVQAEQQQESGKSVQGTDKQLAELQAQLAALQQLQAEQQQESGKSVQETAKQVIEMQAQLAEVKQLQAEQQQESGKVVQETAKQVEEQQQRQQQQQQQLAEVLAQLQALQAQLEDKHLQLEEGLQQLQQGSLQKLQEWGTQVAELEHRLAEQEGQLKSAVLEPRDMRASHRPGLEAVAAMLEVLGRGPCDAQRRLGMATAAAALQALAETPESAASHREFSVAVKAMKQMGKDPGDQAYREGLEAASAAIAAVVKNADTGVHNTDFGAAAAALQSICQVPWDAECRPGVMAGVLGLKAMADDPKQASHELGIRAAISVLHALGCDPGDPDQREGLAAASTALETMSTLPVLPGHGPGLSAACVSLNALRHVAQEADVSQNRGAAADSEPDGGQGPSRRRVSGAVTATSALEKLGMVPHDEVHHPGMLAAAAALRAYAEGPRSSALELSPAEEAKKAYGALRTEAASTALPAMKQHLESLEQQLQHMPALQEQVAAMKKQLQQAQQALGLGLSALGLDESGLGVPDKAAMPAKQKQFEELAAAVRTLEAKEGKDAALKESLSQAISAMAAKLAEIEQEAKVLKDTCVHKSELKELENFLLDRINLQDSGHELMRLTLDVIVADITKLATEHGVSIHEERKPKDKSTPLSQLQPFTLSTVLRNFMSYSELVERFATLKGLQEVGNAEKMNSEMARKNEEAILLALKSVDQKFTSQADSMAKVLIRTARQVDYLQNMMREMPGAEEMEIPQTGAGIPHPAQGMDELVHQPMNAGGLPHPLQAMGELGRSSGMRALLMHQTETSGENAVDLALRSVNENAAENVPPENTEQEGYGRSSSGLDPRKHISSASPGWAMALKHMKPRPSQGEQPNRESAGWNLLQLAAQEESKPLEPEASKGEEKQTKVPEGRNKVFAQPRPSRTQEPSPGHQQVLLSPSGRSRGAPPASPAEPPTGSVFARRGADPPGVPKPPAARFGGDKRGAGGRHHRAPQSYLPPGAVAPPS